MPPCSRLFNSSVSMRLLTSCLRMSSKASARPSTSCVLLRQLVSAPSTRSSRKVRCRAGESAGSSSPGSLAGLALGGRLAATGAAAGRGFRRVELQPRQQVPRLGHLLDHRVEPLPQHQLAGFQHRPQLLRRDHVEHPALAAGDVRAVAEVAEVGRLDAHQQLLARLQSQLAHLQRRVGEIEIRGMVRGTVRNSPMVRRPGFCWSTACSNHTRPMP